MPFSLGANRSVKIGTSYDWVGGTGPNGDIYGQVWYQGGINLSSSNPRRNGKYVNGGNWYMRKTESRIGSGSSTIYRPGYGVAYIGSHVLSHWGGKAHPTLPSNWESNGYRDHLASSLAGRGAEAWNRLRPAKPDFDLGLNLLELKDVPDTLKQSIKAIISRIERHKVYRDAFLGKGYSKGPDSKLKRTGEWYLAIQFGWLPVLKSVRDFIKTHQRQQKLFDQIVRDAGRPVRRRSDLRDTTYDGVDKNVVTQFKDSFASISPTLVTQCYLNSGRTYGELIQSQSSRTWAVGRFRYYLPPGPRTIQWKKKIMRRIFGFRPTPSLVYNLMPWTWLADYFTTLGSFMQSVSSGVEDRLAADYFYLMRTLEWSWTSTRYRLAASTKEGPPFKEVGGTLHSIQTIKMRMRGSPFGFGVNENDLSLNQKAILGALGLSKLPSYSF